MSNLFLVLRGVLVTPDLSRCGVDGIVRETLLANAGLDGLPAVSVRRVDDEELEGADEVFLSNSIRGVLPVRQLDRRELGAPGPVTTLAQRILGDAGVLA
jgi:4-amino-4-deoxychorismate lyase